MKLLEKIDNYKNSYNKINENINLIDDHNKKAILKMFDLHGKRIANAPGAKKSHQPWPGGYMDHISHMLQLAEAIYYPNKDNLNFSFGDVVLVILLHDFEKPFLYVEPVYTKEEWRKEFVSFGFKLTKEHLNALKYAHGENDDYIPHERIMNELAGILHAVDVLSARTFYNRKEYPEDWYKDIIV